MRSLTLCHLEVRGLTSDILKSLNASEDFVSVNNKDDDSHVTSTDLTTSRADILDDRCTRSCESTPDPPSVRAKQLALTTSKHFANAGICCRFGRSSRCEIQISNVAAESISGLHFMLRAGRRDWPTIQIISYSAKLPIWIGSRSLSLRDPELLGIGRHVIRCQHLEFIIIVPNHLDGKIDATDFQRSWIELRQLQCGSADEIESLSSIATSVGTQLSRPRLDFDRIYCSSLSMATDLAQSAASGRITFYKNRTSEHLVAVKSIRLVESRKQQIYQEVSLTKSLHHVRIDDTIRAALRHLG